MKLSDARVDADGIRFSRREMNGNYMNELARRLAVLELATAYLMNQDQERNERETNERTVSQEPGTKTD